MSDPGNAILVLVAELQEQVATAQAEALANRTEADALLAELAAAQEALNTAKLVGRSFPTELPHFIETKITEIDAAIIEITVGE
jgi:hypothetical protein